MLDLNNVQKLYEIKMLDGEILTLRTPSQGLYRRLLDMAKMKDGEMTAEDSLAYIANVVTEILNLNTNGKKYTSEEIEDMLDFNTMMIVIQDYLLTTTKALGE